MFLLEGKVQHYAWGGKSFIPSLLGISNREERPFAEYWMGIHSAAPSVLIKEDGQQILLEEYLQQHPQVMGQKVLDRFHQLPYLLKVLDVKDMLSIQVHPDIEGAIEGFERENAMGVPLGASHRNYKDRNHKPEMILALSDFWLLHGFKTETNLVATLESVDEFSVLLPVFEDKGYRGLYMYLMQLPPEGVEQLLRPLANRILPLYAQNKLNKNQPDFWAARAMINYPDQLDRGIFSIYLFNLVYLQKGEGIFQSYGLPHAYLEGQNIELMSNSDNVLRGGLTPKHVDVPELMKHTRFEGIIPKVIIPERNQVAIPESNQWIEFDCPVPDFSLTHIQMKSDGRQEYVTSGPEILFVLKGEGVVQNNARYLKVHQGSSIFLSAGESITLHSDEMASLELVRAFVP
ncbi:MAG: mannose-6-phosphate isomerase, class I [Chitinophagaceae bacterium]